MYNCKATLTRHQRTHAELPFKCTRDGCGMTFNLKQSLYRHMRFACVKGEEVTRHYSCTLCTKKFREQGDLNRHLKTHENASFKCLFCSATFKFVDDRKKHYKENHQYEKNAEGRYQCLRCNKSYTRSDHIRVHINSKHEGIMFTCDICHKEFSSEKYLL